MIIWKDGLMLPATPGMDTLEHGGWRVRFAVAVGSPCRLECEGRDMYAGTQHFSKDTLTAMSMLWCPATVTG